MPLSTIIQLYHGGQYFSSFFLCVEETGLPGKTTFRNGQYIQYNDYSLYDKTLDDVNLHPTKNSFFKMLIGAERRRLIMLIISKLSLIEFLYRFVYANAQLFHDVSTIDIDRKLNGSVSLYRCFIYSKIIEYIVCFFSVPILFLISNQAKEIL